MNTKNKKRHSPKPKDKRGTFTHGSILNAMYPQKKKNTVAERLKTRQGLTMRVSPVAQPPRHSFAGKKIGAPQLRGVA